MRNAIKNSSNKYSTAIKESRMKQSSNTLIYNTILKLRTIIAIGALISLTACSSHTLHSSEEGLAISSYPVIQF